jgi:hypothetical protein
MRIKLAVLGLNFFLAACGGGGGGGGSGSSGAPAASALSGVAAVGDPIVNADVRLICAAGNAPLSVKTGTTGNWQIILNGQALPCAVQASGGTINGVANTSVYHSVALKAGTVNVTPLTDLLVANLVGTSSPATWFSSLSGTTAALAAVTQTRVDLALANLNAAFPTLPLYAVGSNPITSVFTPTPGNPHDDMLSALRTALTNSGIPYSSLLSNASATSFLPPASLSTALSTAYQSTTSGSTAVYFPLDSAFTTLESSALTITMSGNYFGNTLSLTRTSAPIGGPQNFDGRAAIASSFSGSLTYLGKTSQLSTSTSYFSAAPYKRLGDVGPNWYTVYSNQIPLPSKATIGSSGSFNTGTEYADATRTTLLSTFVETWSLAAGTASGTAKLCVHTTTQLPSGTAAPTVSSVCVTTDTAGNVLQLQSLGSLDGTVLTLTSTSIATPPPVVVSTLPVSGAVEIETAAPVMVTFNKPIDPRTITNSTFTLYGPDGPVTGTVSVNGATATFTPSAPLASDSWYFATISGSVRDVSGTVLGSGYPWNFKTKLVPKVVTTNPPPYSYPFALNGVIAATFNTALDASTVNVNNFKVFGPSGPIAGTVGYSGLTATFTPTVPLTVNTVYRASITSGVKDLSGEAATDRSWTFQTFAPGTAATPQPFTPVPFGLWQPPAGVTPSSGNYVYLQSDVGDYIGGGQTNTFTPMNAQLSFSVSSGSVRVSVTGNSYWTGDFFGPSALNQIQVGYYSGLIRWPFHNPVLGGLSWSGDGRGCNTLLGWFAVDNVIYTNGIVTGVDLRFEQQCEGSQAALHGAVHWRQQQ